MCHVDKTNDNHYTVRSNGMYNNTDGNFDTVLIKKIR